MIVAPPFIPVGYRVVRVLSERPGSWVFLAFDPQESACCLKIQQVAHPEALGEVAASRQILRPLTEFPGFIPMVAWGVDPAHSVLWEEMSLSDDLLTFAGFSVSSVDTYTPLTLALWAQNNGPVETLKVLNWGIQLAGALRLLHQHGLFHRDIKPANLLIYQGQCVLGDYGSIGRTGSTVEFPGTEGYVAPDGLGSPALDIFALGRSLYEVWTGLDRFQFPSLPNSVMASADWETHGWQLNDVLISAADGRVSQRVPSALALQEALMRARAGKRRISRRKILMGVAGVLTSGVAVYLWKNRPPYRAIWTRIGQRGAYESWVGTELMVDWKQRMFYSLNDETRFVVLQSINLNSFEHKDREFPPMKYGFFGSFFDEKSKELTAVSWTTGKILGYSPDSGEVRTIHDGNLERNELNGYIYRNPVNQSIGCFGGYGNHRVVNDRWEYDIKTGVWNQVLERADAIPWKRSPRQGGFMFSDPQRRRWYLVGGLGNRSGEQGEVVAGLKQFQGDFYPLGDLWELDLLENQWRNLLGLQSWMPPGLKSAVFHSGTNSVAFVVGSQRGDPQEATVWLQNLHRGNLPIRLPNSGAKINAFNVWSCLVEPESQDLWLFVDEGIYSVKLVPA